MGCCVSPAPLPRIQSLLCDSRRIRLRLFAKAPDLTSGIFCPLVRSAHQPGTCLVLSSLLLHLRRLLDSVDDPDVARASAEIARYRFRNLVASGSGVAV